MKTAILALVLLGLVAGCGTVASVRALRQGQSSVAISAGGPVAEVSGMSIPVPYAVARYRYGASDRLGLYAGGHLLMASFGVIGIDAGGSYRIIRQSGAIPELNAGAGIAALIEAGDGNGQAVLPEANLAASWLWKRRFLTYAGVQGMMQLSPGVRGAFAPYVGQEVYIGRGFSANAEVKWYAPTEATKPRVVNFTLPVAGQGDLGAVLGVSYGFGGWYE
jgi:hypothetical protein